MSASPEENEHEVLERILAQIEIEMLKGDTARVQQLQAQVDALLEPRWPLESGTRWIVRS
jgi:hypothetical protein